MTATQDNTQTLPAKAGVYIIRDATLPEYTLYVGIASDLKTRLSPSHSILEYCRNRGIEYTIDWELEPNEKKRKKREHQLISELDAKLNDGGIPSESCQTEPEWQDDIKSLIDQLENERVETDLNSYDKQIEEWKQVEFCASWFSTACQMFDTALTRLIYGRELRESSLERFKDSELFEHTDPGRVLLNSIGSPDDYYIFWFEPNPAFQGVGSSIILDSLHQVIYGYSFDLDFKGVEERFLRVLPYLNPTIADQWELFKRHVFSERRFWSLRDTIQDFCDHAVVWKLRNGLSLFHPDVRKELLITKFFLEYPYEQKCLIEETFNHYVSVADYVTAVSWHVNNILSGYKLQYRIPENYNSHRDYLSDSIELRLISTRTVITF